MFMRGSGQFSADPATPVLDLLHDCFDEGAKVGVVGEGDIARMMLVCCDPAAIYFLLEVGAVGGC
jgi:fructose-1,6-bisphosphatase/sedoheptulose 1,7-bisphosphatase-like protein